MCIRLKQNLSKKWYCAHKEYGRYKMSYSLLSTETKVPYFKSKVVHACIPGQLLGWACWVMVISQGPISKGPTFILYISIWIKQLKAFSQMSSYKQPDSFNHLPFHIFNTPHLPCTLWKSRLFPTCRYYFHLMSKIIKASSTNIPRFSLHTPFICKIIACPAIFF